MKTIATSKYLDFKSTKSPSNHNWYYVKRTNDSQKHDSAVVITTLVKLNNEYNFLLIKTNRPPITTENKAKFCLESPAGLIGDINTQEDTLECAKKELLEEAGLIPSKIYLELVNSSTSAGLSSETLTYVTAIVEDNTLKQAPIDDGGIILERFYAKSNEIINYIQNLNQNEISVSAATVCGIFFALNRLKLIIQK